MPWTISGWEGVLPLLHRNHAAVRGLPRSRGPTSALRFKSHPSQGPQQASSSAQGCFEVEVSSLKIYTIWFDYLIGFHQCRVLCISRPGVNCNHRQFCKTLQKSRNSVAVMTMLSYIDDRTPVFNQSGVCKIGKNGVNCNTNCKEMHLVAECLAYCVIGTVLILITG